MEERKPLSECRFDELVRLEHEGAYYFAFPASEEKDCVRPSGYILLADSLTYHRAKENIKVLCYKHMINIDYVDIEDAPPDRALRPGSIALDLSLDPPHAGTHLIFADAKSGLLFTQLSDGGLRSAAGLYNLPITGWQIHLVRGIPYVDPNYIFDAATGRGREVDT